MTPFLQQENANREKEHAYTCCERGREGETARIAAPLPAASCSPDIKCIRVPSESTNICCHNGDLNSASPDAYTCRQIVAFEYGVEYVRD